MPHKIPKAQDIRGVEEQLDDWENNYLPPTMTCIVGMYFLIAAELICTFTDSSVIAPSQELYQLTLCDLASAQLAPFSPVALNTYNSSNVIRWLAPSCPHIYCCYF